MDYIKEEHDKGQQAKIFYIERDDYHAPECITNITKVVYGQFGVEIDYSPPSPLVNCEYIAKKFIPYHSLHNIDYEWYAKIPDEVT